MLVKHKFWFLLLVQSKNLLASISFSTTSGMKRKSTTSVDDERRDSMNSISDSLLNLEKQLIYELTTHKDIKYDADIEYIYNPLDYAFDLHAKYVHRYCNEKKKILFLGMNPGPWGMVQCGIPFGEIKAVKNYLKIEGTVKQPEKFHKLRPVQGLDCPRSEISGQRFWGLADKLSKGNANEFFKHAYVHNYFPLAFVSKTAKNITPAELKNKKTIDILNEISDRSLSDIVKLLGIETIIAIGKFAETRAIKALKNNNVTDVKVTSISHPSPRNPASNKNWIENTTKKLKEINVLQYF